MTLYESIANRGTQTHAVRMLLKTLADVQCTSTRKRVPATYFTKIGEEGAQMLKSLLHFARAYVLLSDLQSVFYPWSAVCALHCLTDSQLFV